MTKVLIVEDDPLFTRHMRWMLSTSAPEADVDSSRTWKAAKGKIAAKCFDVLFLDWRLPDARGAAKVAEARQVLPAARIAIVTGELPEEITNEALAAGADVVIGKGADIAGFSRALCDVLKH